MTLASELLTYIIRPALGRISLGGTAAEELVLGTALQESDGLRHLRQIGGGPGCGFWQIEPKTGDDLYTRITARDSMIARALQDTRGQTLITHALTGNLMFGAMICRLKYRDDRQPIPPAGDLEAQAAYWKRVYNTERGKGRVEDYIRHWQIHVGMAQP